MKEKLTKPTKHNCRYRFTESELLQIGKELAEHNGELSALEQDKKRVVADFGAKITGKESDVSIAVNKIQSGYEWRDLPCTIHYNVPKTGKKRVIRDDTNEQVDERDMTPDELQMELPGTTVGDALEKAERAKSTASDPEKTADE